MTRQLVRLGDLIKDARPGFASGKNPPDGVFQFRMNNLTTEGRLDFSAKRRVPPDSPRLSHYLLEPGDVLFNATNSPELVGKSAFFPGYEEPAVFSNHFLRLRPEVSRLDARYLSRWLVREFQRGTFLHKCKRWVNQAAVSKEILLALRIPLPPIQEQRRIADVLDRVDDLRAKRRLARKKLETLKLSIFAEMFGNYWTNPKGYAASSLGDAATLVGGGTPSRAVPSYFEGSICWATSKDMKHEYLDDTQEHITDEAIDRSATNLVPPGSILIVVKSKVLAHSLPLAIARVPTCFGQDIKAIRVSTDWNVYFVAWALRVHREWLLRKARGINTEGLTLEHLRAFPLLRPPLDIQNEFAVRVQSVDSLINDEVTSSKKLEELFGGLGQRAFAGAL